MTIEINLPDIGTEGVVEVTEVFVKIGDNVKEEQSLITVEGDKASIEIPAPFSGIIKELKVCVGDKISIGSPIAIFEAKDSEIMDSEKKETSSSLREEGGLDIFKKDVCNNDSNPYATPQIRRLAREFDIDLTKIQGSGRKGRISREDVQIYIRESVKNRESGTKTKNIFLDTPISVSSCPEVDFGKFGEVEKLELNRIQKISGANLSRNWTSIPHVTHFDKVDITELELFRKQQINEFEKQDLNVKITPVVFIMKVIAFALERMPRFNSSLSEDCQYLILKKYVNIGVAVDTLKGLVVPVFKDVNRKGIIELSRELAVLTKKARDGKLNMSEMQGGCFTISSIGKLGTTHFSPIINAPEVAILGVSKSSIEPVWNGKKFISRLILPISLSFDHRVIDGADGARFITFVKDTLSDIRHLVM